jgi:hypothetical protein
MPRNNAKWSLLTKWLIDRNLPSITLTWEELGDIVGGLPNSATDHFQQWWYGDRPNTRAWREAGYELSSVQLGRTLTLVKVSEPQKRLPGGGVPHSTSVPLRNFPAEHFLGPEELLTINKNSVLIVLPCSKAKQLGGIEMSATSSSPWSPELLAAREHLSERAQLDKRLVMPAWHRYTGGFYKATEKSLSDAVFASANIAILSGGYGVVRANEEIGWYERALKKSEWPRGLIEDELISEAKRVGAKHVVAFAARTSSYAQIITSTRWKQAGIERAVLVTSQRRGGGAMSKVPPDLGRAFRAFWLGLSEEYPADISCEELA